MDDALEATGLCLIKEHNQRERSTIALQVDFRPIYDMCNGAEQIPESSWLMRWWYQDVGGEE